MAKRRPKPEEIVTKLRQVEVLTGQGMPRLDAIRQIGVTVSPPVSGPLIRGFSKSVSGTGGRMVSA